jgi:hypothetical protein
VSNFIKGLSVSGEVIEGMKDKTFTIIAGCTYREFPDLDNPEQKKEKLVIPVRLSDGSQLDYLANKESQKTMVALAGYNMDNWIGQKFEWEIREMKVFKEVKKVLFVLPKKFDVKEKIIPAEDLPDY